MPGAGRGALCTSRKQCAAIAVGDYNRLRLEVVLSFRCVMLPSLAQDALGNMLLSGSRSDPLLHNRRRAQAITRRTNPRERRCAVFTTPGARRISGLTMAMLVFALPALNTADYLFR